MDKVDEKINKFMNLLKERTIDPIEVMDIKESCTATLLLIFAAIDSLSKITCDDSSYEIYSSSNGNKDVGKRFKDFLTIEMDKKYSQFKGDIYALRNDIVHTGIPIRVTLSKHELNRNSHLQKKDGNLFINTLQLLDDFKRALEVISINIKDKGKYFHNASKRLKNFNLIELDEEYTIPFPSRGADEPPFHKEGNS